MNNPNQAYSRNTFDESASGWGEDNELTGVSGYGYDNDVALSQSAWGAVDTALNTDRITNPYAENPFETNVFDNAYTETFSDPNPTYDYSKRSGLELE